MSETTQTKQDATKASDISPLLADLELLSRQLRCVKHLCQEIKNLSNCHETLLANYALKSPFMVNYLGIWSAQLMKSLSSVLDNCDATDEEQAQRWQGTFYDMEKREWKHSQANADAMPSEGSESADC